MVTTTTYPRHQDYTVQQSSEYAESDLCARLSIFVRGTLTAEYYLPLFSRPISSQDPSGARAQELPPGPNPMALAGAAGFSYNQGEEQTAFHDWYEV